MVNEVSITEPEGYQLVSVEAVFLNARGEGEVIRGNRLLLIISESLPCAQIMQERRTRTVATVIPLNRLVKLTLKWRKGGDTQNRTIRVVSNFSTN